MGYAGLEPEDPNEIGPYRLLGKLGQGGMGQVFLGASADGQPVAVKVLRPELAGDPGFRARLRPEVTAAQRVSSPFAAPVVNADLDAEVPWLATAYVSGPSLAGAIQDYGPLPIGAVLALTAGLAEGLGAIHAAGVVHGNLKPSNVLLGDDGPQVTDFGISQAAEASLGRAGGQRITSPGYVSPEQVLGAEAGPASDLFSLGAILTFAVTGAGPFGSGPDATLMDRVVNAPPDLGAMPAKLRSLAAACLTKKPHNRPTPEDLLARVRAIQSEPGMAEAAFAGFAAGLQTVSSDTPAGSPVSLGAGDGVPLAAAASGPTGPGASRSRWRRPRSLIPAYVTGGLVVVSAVTVLALTKPGGPTSDTSAQLQAGAVATTAPATVPARSTSAKSSPSATPSHSAAGPVVNVLPSPSVSPSALPVTTKPSATASATPSKSPAKSASPSPSKSATKSVSPSPSHTSPTVSKSATTSSSSSPSSTATSTTTAKASTSTSPS